MVQFTSHRGENEIIQPRSGSAGHRTRREQDEAAAAAWATNKCSGHQRSHSSASVLQRVSSFSWAVLCVAAVICQYSLAAASPQHLLSGEEPKDDTKRIAFYG